MRAYWELCKPKISGLSALSAVVGFILASGGIGSGAALVAAGVFFLACGACGLNQYQDRLADAIMTRTKGRPLPSGRISATSALALALCMTISGLGILAFMRGSGSAFLLGLLALFWYNGVYAFLKRRTAFAAVPGALVGALPPAIGWTAAGGLLTDTRLVFLCFFFFMWQTPHFWLLLLDYGSEYEAAGLPSLTRTFNRSQLRRIIYVWMAAAAVSGLLIGMERIVKSPVVNIGLCVSSAWLIWSGAGLFCRGRSDYSSAFHKINIFALIVMMLLSVDGLFRNIVL